MDVESLQGVLYTINDFNELVQEDLDGLVGEICSHVSGRRPSPKEVEAMKRSYEEVSMALAEAIKQKPSLASAYIGVPMVKFEYKLPSAPAWCDLVMLGVSDKRRQAVIVELKDWFKRTNRAPRRVS